ncbi:MAG: hypothetical protein ACK55I_48265, partial [bacterium]
LVVGQRQPLDHMLRMAELGTHEDGDVVGLVPHGGLLGRAAPHERRGHHRHGDRGRRAMRRQVSSGVAHGPSSAG